MSFLVLPLSLISAPEPAPPSASLPEPAPLRGTFRTRFLPICKGVNSRVDPGLLIGNLLAFAMTQREKYCASLAEAWAERMGPCFYPFCEKCLSHSHPTRWETPTASVVQLPCLFLRDPYASGGQTAYCCPWMSLRPFCSFPLQLSALPPSIVQPRYHQNSKMEENKSVSNDTSV